jgi:putative FmdB family regulatory protein
VGDNWLMPFYSYRCLGCGYAVDKQYAVADSPDTIVCPKCHKIMTKQLPRIQVSVPQEFTTTAYTGKPVTVSSRRQEKDLEKATGIRQITSDEADVKPRRKKHITPITTIKQDYDKTHAAIKAGDHPLAATVKL